MAKSASVTSFDVARLAGVSRAAVSRTFTPGASVSDATRQKVLDAANQLGYRVNFLGRALHDRRTNFVAVLASRMDNPVRSKQIRDLCEALLEDNMLPILLISDGIEDFETRIEEVLQYQVCGIIVTSDTPPMSVARRCAMQGTPLITVNKAQSEIPVDRVLSGNDGAATRAAELFGQTGCRTVIGIRTGNNSFTVNRRMDVFLETAKGLGLETHEILVPDMSYADGQTAADIFINRYTAVEDVGVFCAADYLALGFMDQIKHVHHRNIPEDLQVIGFDDIPEAAQLSHALTTFRHDTREMAKQCVALLKKRMENPDLPVTTVDVASDLVTRASTA